MVFSRLSLLVLGFGGDFSLVHTTLAVVSGCFVVFQGVSGVSGSAVNGHGHGQHCHSNTALYISLVIIYTKYTGLRQNDFNAHA
jgi:hypothetical protein